MKLFLKFSPYYFRQDFKYQDFHKDMYLQNPNCCTERNVHGTERARNVHGTCNSLLEAHCQRLVDKKKKLGFSRTA